MSRPWRSAALPLAAMFLVAAGCTGGSDTKASSPELVTAPTADGDQTPAAGTQTVTVPAQSSGEPRTITIIGDSISLGATDEYHAVMPLDDVTVVATSGIKLAAQREAITEAVDAHPDVLVIELGTNNVPGYQPEFLTEIDDVLDETDALPCVRWVTVYVPKAERSVSAVNDHLEEELAAHPNLQLVDWFSMVQDDSDLLSDDGLHPNVKGQEALAWAVAAATTTCDAT